jgi:ADP-ribose pyrophosphatase YjhB (NUDIX family)
MEDKILNAFLYNNRLKFAEIEKQLKVRSNKLSYHLKNLTKKGFLEKEGEFYKLTEDSETLIPYLSEKKAVLSVILVAIKKNNNQVFLHKRKKRPFYNKLALPGGRMLLNESIQKATKRIAKKYNITYCKFEKVNSVSLEHVVNKDKVLHSFFLFFVTATSNNKEENVVFTNIKENKEKIIPSDYKLIKNDLRKEISIKELFTQG